MKKSLISNLYPFLTRIPLLDIKRQVEILRDDDQKGQIRSLVAFTFLFSTAYFLLPFDIIPDVLLGLGYLDDLAIYAFMREVAYVGSENDIGIKQSLYMTVRSKVMYIVFAILVILVLLLVSVYMIL